jgi:MFS family permease
MTAVELPPRLSELHPAKPQYAGWLLGAYAAPPLLTLGVALATDLERNQILIAGAALTLLAPAAVHLFAGEYGRSARAAGLLLAFTAGGVALGGLVGVVVGALVPQNEWSREEDPGLYRFIGLVSGMFIGGALGALTWATLDVRETFVSDGKRRDRAARGTSHVSFGVVPRSHGVAATLAATF